jgi:transposase-like protein
MAKRSSRTPRRHWTEADAHRVLDDWERTGGTLEAFARSRGLVPQRIAWWRNRLRDRRLAAPAVMTFVQATVLGAGPADPAAVIRLPHGIAIELTGTSPGWVAALARELMRSPS